MTSTDETGEHNNRTLYIVLAVIVVVLMVIGLIAFRSGKSSIEAEAKADQLIAAFQAKNLPTPDKQRIVNLLGTDGGSACADPNSGLRRAILNDMMVNGSGGPGSRPVIVDRIVVRGQVLIMGIYCPDKLAEFAKFAARLKVADVIRQR